ADHPPRNFPWTHCASGGPCRRNSDCAGGRAGSARRRRFIQRLRGGDHARGRPRYPSAVPGKNPAREGTRVPFRVSGHGAKAFGRVGIREIVSAMPPSPEPLASDPLYLRLKEHVVRSTGLTYYEDKDADLAR